MNGMAGFMQISIFTYICFKPYMLNSPGSFYSGLQKSTAVINCIRYNEEYSLQKC